MKSSFRFFSLIAFCTGLLVGFDLRAQDEDGAKRSTEAGKAEAGKDAKAAESRLDGEAKAKERVKDFEVSEEDRERVNRLLRQVWGDPAVVQSRDEVRVASDNLRKVLGEKMRELDPEAAELLAKMRKDSRFPGGTPGDSRGNGGPGGRKPHHAGSGQAGLDYMARPPFYASLSKEQKEIYDAAYKKALESEELEGVVARLEALRAEDDELRKKRIQQFMGARKIISSAMIKADPRVKNLIPKREEGDRRGEGPRPPKPKPE